MKIYTEEAKVEKCSRRRAPRTRPRDARVENMTDETSDTFYSCTLCQSFAPNHVCVVAPERTGLCGAYNWLDCKASYEINPDGPNQPIEKGEVPRSQCGQFKGATTSCSRPRGRRSALQLLQPHGRSHDHLRLL